MFLAYLLRQVWSIAFLRKHLQCLHSTHIEKSRLALCDATRKEKLYAENITKIGEQSSSGPAESAIFKDSEKYRCFRSGKQEAG